MLSRELTCLTRLDKINKLTIKSITLESSEKFSMIRYTQSMYRVPFKNIKQAIKITRDLQKRISRSPTSKICEKEVIFPQKIFNSIFARNVFDSKDNCQKYIDNIVA